MTSQAAMMAAIAAWCISGFIATMVVNVNNLKNGRKPVKLQKESPAGCAGEAKQSERN